MRLLILVLLLIVYACTSLDKTLEDSTLTLCLDPRPEVCTMDFRPVCGLRADNSVIRTFSNACMACSELETMAYIDGECDKEE